MDDDKPDSAPKNDLELELANRDAKISNLERELATLTNKAGRVDNLENRIAKTEHQNKLDELEIDRLQVKLENIDRVDHEYRELRAEHESTKRILSFERLRKQPMGIIGRIIVLGNAVTGAVGLLIILCVIAVTLYAAASQSEAKIPPVLENWGGIVLGFYFGTFMGLVKDYMSHATGGKAISSETEDTTEQSPKPISP